MPSAAVTRRGRRSSLITPLQTLRQARTLTQEQLAALVEVGQATLSRYESGELIPPPRVRARLAIILGTQPDVLWPSGDRSRL